MLQSNLRKIAFVGNNLPRKCGIATFTHDMYRSITDRRPDVLCSVIPVNDHQAGYSYGPEVKFELGQHDLGSYLRAADYLNFTNIDVVSLQHEYGIFGGPAGSHILSLVRNLRMPVVTTFHTVLQEPCPDQRRVLVQLADLSSRTVVMTDRANGFLQKTYGVPAEKIDVIAHGIPNTRFEDCQPFKKQLGVAGKQVALTFGLLSPNKGIEHMVRALPPIIEAYPNFVYIVLGATHPELVRQQGEQYRISLEQLAQTCGVSQNVIFENRFVELDELTGYIQAADLYVTPYLNPAQIVSGTLAYTFGCGKPIISTPYWHAEDLLKDGGGVLVPFADSEALAREICSLLGDEARRFTMCRKAYEAGRAMTWDRSADHYLESFEKARRKSHDHSLRTHARSKSVRPPSGFPAWKLDHLESLSDSTGVFQHATYTIPNFEEGYCTDDNARTLLLTVLLDELGRSGQVTRRLATTTAAFLQFAFDHDRKRFRNFLGFDRRWRELVGSDDCQGRALWALGACVGRSRWDDLPAWAATLFQQALAPVPTLTSPRAWALSLLGIHEYTRRFRGDRFATQTRQALSSLLVKLYEHVATPDWQWFEEIVSYDNARLCQALIVTGVDHQDSTALKIGLESLAWLMRIQRSPEGHFRAVGCQGFYRKGSSAAQFDQQPLEAAATVSACIAAYRATKDSRWLDEAQVAFDWFLGRNDLGLDLYACVTGGCFDGLQDNRVNRNQGAESTLSFLLAMAEMQLLQKSLVEHRHPNTVKPARENLQSERAISWT